MNKEDYLKIFHKVQEEIKYDNNLINQLSEGPIDLLVKDALTAMNKPQINWLGQARDPASVQLLEGVGNQLGASIPGGLQSFYLASNGFESLSEDFPYPFLPIAELRLGGGLSPKLSQWVKAHQADDSSRAEGEPLPVYSHDDTDSLANELAAFLLPLDELDQMIVLEDSVPYRKICFSQVRLNSYRKGAILEIERSVATIYPGIRPWLASMIVRFKS